MKIKTERLPTGDALEVLSALEYLGWHIGAYDLAMRTRQLNTRGRISELKLTFGIPIDATWVMVNRKKHTTYTVRKGFRVKARKLLRKAQKAESEKALSKRKIMTHAQA